MAGVAGSGGEDAVAESHIQIDDVSQAPGVLVLKVAGELDLATAEPLRAAVEQAIERGARTAVFDLSELAFMDSSGIALLVTVAEQIDALEVREPSAIVRRVIEISGLAETLGVTP